LTKLNAHIEIECNASTIQELNEEVGQLKCVVGFMLAKLYGESGQQVINELKDWGLIKSSKEFDQFVNPRPPINK